MAKNKERDRFLEMNKLACCIALIFAVVLYAYNTHSYIDSYVYSCELSAPYTCLDASFDNGDVSLATYGGHRDIVLEGCAHMQETEYDNGKHVLSIYSFHCARGDSVRDIYIDGEREGQISFSSLTGW